MHLSPDADAALLDLLAALSGAGYRFITPTPATHARVLGRVPDRLGKDLRDIFGWSRAFRADALPADLLRSLDRADALQRDGDLLRSKVRVSSLGDDLFLHSAYPTEAEDAVFFGPDTYRFAELIRVELPRFAKVGRLVDLGTGSGAGGIAAARVAPDARITLVDINPVALRLAAINARHAGVEVELVECEDISCVEGDIDCVIANPPYIMDEHDRDYRNGGDMHGARLSLDWTVESARRLTSGGRVLLYTGSAIVDGRDTLHEALAKALPEPAFSLSYRELDPDVFGEELETAAYADVERIAIVGAVVKT